jgi:hypothetical protein
MSGYLSQRSTWWMDGGCGSAWWKEVVDVDGGTIAWGVGDQKIYGCQIRVMGGPRVWSLFNRAFDPFLTDTRPGQH